MPSINEALFAARAGIQAHGGAIAVLADNIANANTVAFKKSRPEFSDLVAGNLGGVSVDTVGSGSEVNRVTTIFNQGTFEFTGRGLDMAVDGNGFLIARDSNNADFYTRAGNLSVDPAGILRTPDGLSVLGFPSNGSGGLEQINVNERLQAEVDTNTVTIGGNLDASTPILTGGIPAIPAADSTAAAGPATFADLNANSEFSTFLDVFDSLGGSHSVTTFFFHTNNNEWVANSYVDGQDINDPNATAGEPFLIGSVTIGFANDGTRLTTPTLAAPDFTAAPNWSNGAAAGNISFLFNPFSQFASPSNIESIAQDGSGAGSVVGFSIDIDGTIKANLDNGQSTDIGVLALANFSNVEGLARRGGTLYAETTGSGEPVIGVPGAGQFGTIQPGALEQSTSDIAGDFIKLISFQRAFQSSSRIITNVDDLLQEITNLV